MTGDRRAPADVKVLGFYGISIAHVHSPARRTLVIQVPREDDVCNSGDAVLDTAMYGTKDAAQCFDVASENAMTAMEFTTGTFSLVRIIGVQLTCLCSDKATTLWCQAREHNKRSSRNYCQYISSSSIFPRWDHAQHWRTSQTPGY